MKTYIITDSTSEISQKTAEDLSIIVLPLSVAFGEKTYSDGVNLSSDEFFHKLENCKELPKTSQVSPKQFEKCFKEILKDPESEIFGIFISSKLSGTYNSARIAAEETCEKRIYLSDSLTATGALGLLVFIAHSLRSKGMSALDIKEKIDSIIPKTKLMVVFTSLKYLKAGGRISPATAAMGGLLKIFPVAEMDKNGEIQSIGKSRGKAAAMDFVFSKIEKNPADTSYPISLVHSNAPHLADEVMKRYSENYSMERCLISTIGPVIGTHTGPGCFGIAYITK